MLGSGMSCPNFLKRIIPVLLVVEMNLKKRKISLMSGLIPGALMLLLLRHVMNFGLQLIFILKEVINIVAGFRVLY